MSPELHPDRRRQARAGRSAVALGRCHADQRLHRQLLQTVLGCRAIAPSGSTGVWTTRPARSGCRRWAPRYKLPGRGREPNTCRIAVILAACEDGLKNSTDPGALTQGSSYDTPADVRFPALLLTLGEAIEAFRADGVLTEALGPGCSNSSSTTTPTSGPGSVDTSPTGSAPCTGMTCRDRAAATRLPGCRSAAAVLAVDARTAGRATSPRRRGAGRRTRPARRVGAGAVGRHDPGRAAAATPTRCCAGRHHRRAPGPGGLHPALCGVPRGRAGAPRRGHPHPADLVGRRVAAIENSTNMALVETFTGAVPVAFGAGSDDVYADMLAALRAEDVDAVVDDDVVFVPSARRIPTTSWRSPCRPPTSGGSRCPRSVPIPWPSSMSRSAGSSNPVACSRFWRVAADLDYPLRRTLNVASAGGRGGTAGRAGTDPALLGHPWPPRRCAKRSGRRR